jgi:parallel beta-helix repeat protein
MNRKIAVLVLALVLMLSLVVIIVEIPNPVKAGTIYVDDDYGSEDPTHKKTIQAGVDNATPGDTIFVYNGIYYEDIVIDKTINLTGENRDTTIINTTDSGIYIENVNYINITGFTIENASSIGIRLKDSNNSIIEYNRIQHCLYGIDFYNVNNSYILNNSFVNVYNYNAIDLRKSSFNLVKNNTITGCGSAIQLSSNSNNNTITNNNCSNNDDGIILSTWSTGNIISNNIVNNNNGIFLIHIGIALGTSANNNIFINNTIKSNKYGIWANSVTGNIFINSTIAESELFDVHIKGEADLTLLNSTFNKSSVEFNSPTSILIVKWYLHINVIDYLGNPIPNANIKIEDNKNSSYEEFFTTDGNGYLQWLIATEYNEKDPNDDGIGEKTYHTPHKIVVWNDTLVGYAKPIMNESKTVTIVLYNGTLLDLEPGWNLVSLPRIQSDTNLQTVLQSIEDQHDAIQWYNVTDSNDPWKHHHISKPSYLNDLEDINHTMGLWIHIIDPGGAKLVMFGDILNSTQNITLYPGWNLVGYPSTTDKTRTLALNNLFFDTDVDAIWTHNATTKKWKEITASDNFEVGRGYWIHAKNKVTWIVPL